MGTIFVALLSLFIPFLLFTTIIKRFTNILEREGANTKENIISFILILFAVALVIFIAVGYYFLFGDLIKFNDFDIPTTNTFFA